MTTLTPSSAPSQQPPQPVTDMDKLRQALASKNIHHRCCETLNVLTSPSMKSSELPSLVGFTIETIFGTYVGGASAWELRSLTRSSLESSQDFASLSTFLGIGGPFLNVVYKLTTNPDVVFNFPLGFLPLPARKKIEAGAIPLFYRNKIKAPLSNQGSSVSSSLTTSSSPTFTHLSLNAFEYFLFHMAFFMVNPAQMRMPQTQQNPNDFVISVLFEHYLKVLLPATSETENCLPSLSTFASPGSWTTTSPTWTPTNGSAVTPRSPSTATSPFKAGLFKQNLCGSPVASNTTSTHGFSGGAGDIDGGLFRQSWRSETFLSVLVEFWLNQNEVDMDKYATPAGTTLQAYLPTLELVRFVRLTVKQVHYFANYKRLQSPVPPHYQSSGSASQPSQVDNSVEEFRNAAVPVFLQKGIYAFLRFGFEKWPLDQGFRMMLETWLSYIQPWRYVDASIVEKEEDKVDEIAEEWLTGGFIRDNLLHFVVPFEDFLRRLFRMDLSSPKNAQMLYRVCKVFNQPRLKEYLLSVEQTVVTPSSGFAAASQLHRNGFQDSYFDGASFLSPSNGFVSGVSLQIAEMERPNFVYQPLFGSEVRGSIEQLVQVIVQALGTTKSLLPPTLKQPEEEGNVVLRYVTSLLTVFSTNGDRAFADDMTVADIKRMEVHLRQSLQHLVDFFDVEAPSNSSSSSSSSPGVSIDDLTVNPRGPPETLGPNAPDNVGGVLTDLGRWQLVNGLKRFEVSGYRGDPDLHPIQSVELAFLVRALYRLSRFVNDRYGTHLERVYARPDVLGRIARQFLLAPCIVENLSPPYKTKKVLANVSKHSRKPRVSLRFLANKQTLGWILLVLLIAPGFGVTRFALLVCLPLVGFFIGVIMALVKPKAY